MYEYICWALNLNTDVTDVTQSNTAVTKSNADVIKSNAEVNQISNSDLSGDNTLLTQISQSNLSDDTKNCLYKLNSQSPELCNSCFESVLNNDNKVSDLKVISNKISDYLINNLNRSERKLTCPNGVQLLRIHLDLESGITDPFYYQKIHM